MKRGIITILILAAAFAGIMFVLNKNKAKNEADTAVVAVQNEAVAVRVDTAKVRSVNAQYLTNGIFMPKQEVKISSETAGKVIRVLVEEGATVRAGQTLAIVDGDKQNVNVSNAQAVFNNAQAELERFESAFSTGGVTKQQLDQVKLQLENAKNNLKSAQLTASDVNIVASFAGVVNKRNIEPGSYVAPGQELFEIVNISTLKLRVPVDEKNITQVQLGQTIKIETAVLPDTSFVGRVIFIAPKADASLNFPVDLEVSTGKDNLLKAGMYATASFGDVAETAVLVIPRNAFVGSISSNQVFIVEKGKAVLKNAVAGRSFGDYIEVSSGLTAGDQVIVSGQINLLDGNAVEIIK
ncbi:efflux RND transporter periplasmic adaptor subunit [Sphingobacterium sp. UT-1RO-CII-1]|uniref:efflux RND transporter periplasmic adaptor subunit n=1 Tax=Sphingobacterium sp. UT-1RO-CII-1 TaxID=2995225 RepID=UPI00227A4E7D|nr:efflux RND transporter periplasmic adaptor subunit [Sphingobacterium sp. UT-1RO-CII-1]MCY4778872.1 efflux RND transporter periplasmic adaptor subunit [Sphingobacterium sp. UT-1RO-CII-1]